MTAAVTKEEFIEEELVYGARRRERLWKGLGLAGALFGVTGCLAAAAVSILDVDPPPVVVPFDSETGVALPNARVEAVSLAQNPAIIQSEVYRYVSLRETYNQLDNDVRVRRVLAMSAGAAEGSLRQLWTSGHENYPPNKYGNDARLDVQVGSINLITNNRAQVRFRKRLASQRGTQTGSFTATLMFEFRPERSRKIDEVWRNPFGFTVVEYAVTSDKLE
ncbi:virB8 family protein [Notoacmeibacter ruber]|uniref:Type IV secretion system protein n=1 Tax=Notoacmeibacter ruber TaxID=2670375 RepID=A0A3L7J631_9HYPH|nr:type IV secretion system protein [Notoacmeibacter ruber]RLQ84961.1 type IV secretion system protein [Notoacmeibacter ruber]